MSMATTLLSNITAAGHPDLPQVMDILARRRGRGSSHFFFFGSVGFFFGLPLLILGFFGAHLMRNPDKAKSYKQRIQQVISAMTSKPPRISDSPHNAPAESSPGRPPRMELAPQPLSPQTPKSPQTHPTPSVNQIPGPPPPLPQQRAPRINLTDGQPNNTDPTSPQTPYHGVPDSAEGLNLKPFHALWVAAALFAMASWLLLAAGCAVGGWVAQRRHVNWPPSLEAKLIRAGLTQHGDGHPSPAGNVRLTAFATVGLSALGGLVNAVMPAGVLFQLPGMLTAAAQSPGATFGMVFVMIALGAGATALLAGAFELYRRKDNGRKLILVGCAIVIAYTAFTTISSHLLVTAFGNWLGSAVGVDIGRPGWNPLNVIGPFVFPVLTAVLAVSSATKQWCSENGSSPGQGALPSDQPTSPGITPSYDQRPIAPPTEEATKEIEEDRVTDGRRPFELDKRVKGIAIGLAVAIGAALLFKFVGTASRTPSPRERADRDSVPVQESTPATAAATETPATVQSQPGPKTKPADIPSVDDPDLGLDVPMSRPACDGTGIVVLGSVYTPGRYREEVGRLLSMNPGASYLRTDVACPSLRQNFDGNPIYAVFRVAGKTKEAICDAVASAGPGTYGKWLDTTTDPTKPMNCDN